MTDSLEFKQGDVVKLKPHPSWIKPLKKYADESRLADVVSCHNPMGSSYILVSVMFRMKRKVKGQLPWHFAAHEVEKVQP